MNFKEELELLHQCAERFDDYTARFGSHFEKIIPEINKKPELYDLISEKAQNIIVKHIHLHDYFDDNVIKSKILKPTTKITLNGCELGVMESNRSEEIVRKVVQNHLNPESWERCSSHIVKHFEKYMTPVQKDTLIPEYEKKNKKKLSN
jgi:hypothetical protein